MTYQEFLTSKRRAVGGHGISQIPDLPAKLYPWQAAIVRWALRKGRAAVFADCGLGKTFMQVAWARALNEPTLIFAPLCVAEQTVDEAAALGVDVRYVQSQDDVHGHPIVITNYERLDHFDVSRFRGVVLDESSILKAFDGATRTALIRACADVPYRLCCTATPSPNDISELANHAEFLGLMTRPEFLATWFIRIDQGMLTTTHHGWRMKRHAVEPFYRWLSSWAVAIRSPRDLGYDDAGFTLPPLSIHDVVLPMADGPMGDALFPEMGAKGLSGRLAARRASLGDRVAAVRQLVASHPNDQWLLWCGLNEESTALADAIPGAIEVCGSDSYAEKVGAVRAFVAGEARHMVSKVRILGYGMNFQHCRRMAFVGIGDSFEQYYQALRRCWRYGQKHEVSAHIVVSEAERNVVQNVRDKERRAADLSANLLRHMQAFERQEIHAA